jgi:hypothetical protein
MNASFSSSAIASRFFAYRRQNGHNPRRHWIKKDDPCQEPIFSSLYGLIIKLNRDTT